MDQMEFEEQFSAYLSESSEINLEDGAFLLAKSQYPKMEISFYRSTLNQMAEDLKKSLGDTQQPLEIIHRFNIFLFEKERFHGNALSYHDPENSYLNRVIDRRKGIPISLSAIYLFLGRRLNLPIFGIGMPIHFILGYEKETQKFLIDPYHKGALLKVQDCVQFLQNSGIPFHSSFLEKVSDQTILARMLRNLQVIYSKTQRQPELNKINHWIETLLQKGPL
jgi:regulator of sirC expression with transglutaminase-like and TPR domain